MIHPSDRQTDRQTDGGAIAYTRYSIMLSRVKINKSQEENLTAFPVLQPPPTRSLTIPAYYPVWGNLAQNGKY